MAYPCLSVEPVLVAALVRSTTRLGGTIPELESLDVGVGYICCTGLRSTNGVLLGRQSVLAAAAVEVTSAVSAGRWGGAILDPELVM